MKTRILIPLVLASAGIAHGQLASLQIDAVSPPGATSGGTTEVTVAGQDLDELSTLSFSHPGITATLMDGARFLVSVANDVPPDIYELRVSGRFGLSNGRPFAVSALPQVSESGENQSAASAMALPFNTHVNGTASAEAADYFRFSATQGQRVFIECAADCLDSRMDATLVLTDSSGAELARDRDSHGKDPFIDFTAPADGDYLVVVHDFQFKGGGNLYYRLLLHTGAQVDFVLPPAGTPGKRERFTVFGRNLPNGRPAPGFEIDGKPLQQTEFELDVPGQSERPLSRLIAAASVRGTALRLPGAHRPVSIALAEAPVAAEREPNDIAANAQLVSVPCEIGGQFFPANDLDWFEFDARKDQTYWVEVFSERLGDATDPLLVVEKRTLDGEGREVMSTVVEGDDIDEKTGAHLFPAKSRDARVSFKADADARYRVLVREQFSGADPRHVYRLVIREPQPDFALIASVQQFTDEGDQLTRATAFLRRNGSLRLKVMAHRKDGFDGPIELTAGNLPAGVAAQPCTIAAGQNEATLTLTAGADAPDSAGPIVVRGAAQVEGAEKSRVAMGAEVLWSVGNWKQEFTASRLTSQVPLAVSGMEAEPVVISLAEDRVYEASLAGTLEIPLQLARRDDIKDKATVRATGLPGLAKPMDFQFDNNAKEAKLVFEFTKKDGNNFTPGDYTVYAQASGILLYRANIEAQERAAAVKAEKDAAVARVESAHKAADDQHKALAEEIARLGEQITSQALTEDEGARLMAEKRRALEQAAAARDAAGRDLEAAKQEQAAAEAAVNQATERAKPQERRFNTVSHPIRVRIAPAPVALQELPQQSVKPEASVEVPVTIERLFGFADVVELSVAASDAASGLAVQPVSVPADASEAKLVISAAKDAAAGDREVRVDAKVKLNGEELVVSRTLKLRVEG